MEKGTGEALSCGRNESNAENAVLSGGVPGNLDERQGSFFEHTEHVTPGFAPDERYWDTAKKRYFRQRNELLVLFGVTLDGGKTRHSRHMKKSHAKKN